MSAKIEALSPGGAAWAKAVRGARAYESLRPESVAKRAMAICARAEGKPAPPRSGARFHFCYSEDPKQQAAIAESIAELKALGVEQITCQSREEYEAKRRADKRLPYPKLKVKE